MLASAEIQDWLRGLPNNESDNIESDNSQFLSKDVHIAKRKIMDDDQNDSRPAKTRRLTPPTTFEARSTSSLRNENENDLTPRPTRRLRSELGSHGAISRRDSSSRSSASSRSTNRSSPTRKRMLELVYAQPTISYRMTESPARIRSMAVLVHAASQKVASRFQEPLQLWQQANLILPPSIVCTEEIASEGLDWASVIKIYQGAKECLEEDAPEEAWSDRVVLKILEYSNALAKMEEKIKVINVKAFQVEPVELLPRVDGLPIPNAKVDYALGLEDVDKAFFKMTRAMVHFRARGVSPSMNPNTSKTLLFRPLFLHLEVKSPLSAQSPQSQLSIWCASQFEQYQRIAGVMRQVKENVEPFEGETYRLPASELPPLVQWSVEGHCWKLYIAEKSSDDEIVIWGPLLTLNTDTPHGILAIIHALAALQIEANSTYREWLTAIFDT